MAVGVPINRSAGGRRVELTGTLFRLTGVDERGRLARFEPDVAGEADELIRASPADQGCVTLRPAVLAQVSAPPPTSRLRRPWPLLIVAGTVTSESIEILLPTLLPPKTMI